MADNRPTLTDEYNHTVDLAIADIRKRIADKGMSLNQFAEYSGINIKVLGRFLTRKNNNISLSFLSQIYHNLDARYEIKSSSY